MFKTILINLLMMVDYFMYDELSNTRLLAPRAPTPLTPYLASQHLSTSFIASSII